MTSYHSIKTDVINAGAAWEDKEVVADQGVITSRNPGNLEAFSKKIIEEMAEGRHTQRWPPSFVATHNRRKPGKRGKLGKNDITLLSTIT